jgi:hypothetical protein
MSYCRFENTDSDLEDCFENMDDTSEMSDEEKKARKSLINKCIEIAIDYGHVVDKDIREV